MADLTSSQMLSNDQRSANNGPRPPKPTQHSNLPFASGDVSDPSAPGSGHLDFSDDSPYLDFDHDGDMDESFNFDQHVRMFGELPEDDEDSADTTHYLHEKRKSIEGNDDDDEGGGKRREGEDKTSKKPGRKPLTSEPTSKRKAQNRAAQRAFRERKERHLKDLETKVEDLEKVSESTTHENGLLRAQVEQLQVEVKEYRKRLSWVSPNGSSRSPSNVGSQLGTGNDFQFEFPKFGDLPATGIFSPSKNQPPQALAKPSPRTSSVPTQSSGSPTQVPVTRKSMSSAMSQAQRSKPDSIGGSPMNNQYSVSPQTYTVHESQKNVDSLTGLFSPSILEATKNSPYGYFPHDGATKSYANARNSFDNSYAPVPGLYSNSSNSNTESPASSSDSHQQSSSIGTSPESNLHSPNHNLQDFGLNTINEENQISNIFNGAQGYTSDLDPTGIDWFAQQNGGGFDPVLFGDYRETQDNVLSQDFGSFFNDAYPLPDLGSPLHNYSDVATNVPEPQKHDLMKQVDAAKNGEEVMPLEPPKMITCNKIWDRLQSMEKFRNGEIDIDNLCSELRAKAKCSEGGAVVAQKHVDKILGVGL